MTLIQTKGGCGGRSPLLKMRVWGAMLPHSGNTKLGDGDHFAFIELGEISTYIFTFTNLRNCVLQHHEVRKIAACYFKYFFYYESN